MKKFQLKSGFILSYTAIFVQSLVSILYTPVMISFLGKSGYGLLQLAISTIANLGFLSFGFGSSYLRFYTKYKASNDKSAISTLNGMFLIIFSAAAVISLLSGSIITANTAQIFAKSMSESEISVLKPLLAVMTVNLALSFPCSVFDSYIVSQERFVFQKLLIIAASLFNPLLTFPLFLLGRGAFSVALCITFITLIKLIASMIFCIVRLKMTFRFHFDAAIFKQLFVFSFFVFLNILSDQINWNVDKTILGILKGAENVTMYSVASQFNSYFLTFSYALATLFSPEAYSLVASGADKNQLSRFFARFGRLQFTVMAYIFMVFIAVGKPFIKLWSGIDSNIPYYTALLLISPILITSIQSIGIEIQRAKDMHKFRSVLYIIIALGNILMSIPLCIKFGEIGCAAGTCLSLTVGNIIIMNFYYHKRVGIDIIYFWKEIFKFIPSLILPSAAMLFIHHFMQTNIISVIICTFMFTVIYIISIFLLGLNKNEKKLIMRKRAA